jgi:hypothetical protein
LWFTFDPFLPKEFNIILQVKYSLSFFLTVQVASISIIPAYFQLIYDLFLASIS